MADFTALKASIQQYIKQNGNEEITGTILQDILLSMVQTMGDTAINGLASQITSLGSSITAINEAIENGYVYGGVATPSSSPATGKLFYIATQAGIYTNFGGNTVTHGINILRGQGSVWLLQQIVGIDDEPTAGSENLVKSGGVKKQINTIFTNTEDGLNAYEPYIKGLYIIPLTSEKYDYLKGLEGDLVLRYIGVRNNNLGTNSIFAVRITYDTSYADYYTDIVPDLTKGNIIELDKIYNESGELGSGFRVFAELNQHIDLSTASGLIGTDKVLVSPLNRAQISLFYRLLNIESRIVPIETELTNKDDVPQKVSTKIVKSGGIASVFEDIIKPLSINLFDKTKLTVGYINSDGEINPAPAYRTSDFIKVTPGVGYACRNNTNWMVCLYDKFGGLVKYYANSNGFNNTALVDQIPDGTEYARFSMGEADVDTAIFADSTEYINRNAWESTTTYKEGIVADKLKNEIIEQSKAVATMQALITWLGNVTDTDKYHYTIYLAEGTYNLTPEIIDSIQTQEYGRIGILLPNNVDLIGLGGGAKIVCDLTGVETGYQQYISPLNIKWNNRLKNLTVEITNGRYAVHADNSNNVHDVKWEIENCTFIHHGNSDGAWSYPYAWGEGGCSGHYAVFRNCKFISPSGAYYAHNNVGFEKPMYHRFDSCVFLSTLNGVAVSLQSLNSGTKDVMEFIGCTFNGILDSRKGSDAAADFNSCDFVVIGGGNSPLCENWYYTDGIPYHSCFGDEVITFINKTESTITSGTFMKYDSDDLKPLTTDDNPIKFVGVCLDNVPVGSIGYIKVKGTIRVIQPSSVVWATLGTKLKVASNTEFAVADNMNIVGKMYYRNTAFTRYYVLLQ